ncbi:MAG TPA: flavin reductase family protein [Thermotogota bacterium]|nr:flavin reductase family protein [Thermotogota bacterium]HRW93641.1 flavin reductase family protein [Thermotogota bacterium]
MKRKLGALQYFYPVPIVLLGVMVEGRANFTELGDCMVAGIQPPLLVVSLHQDHFSTRGIEQNQVFSINVPTTSLLVRVDRCGMESGKQVDKSGWFDWTLSENNAVPLVNGCPVNFECRVISQTPVQQRRIFVAKIEQTWIDEQALTPDGKGIRDMVALDPILYCLDNGYYSVGKRIGEGYTEGKKFQNRGEEDR